MQEISNWERGESSALPLAALDAIFFMGGADMVQSQGDGIHTSEVRVDRIPPFFVATFA